MNNSPNNKSKPDKLTPKPLSGASLKKSLKNKEMTQEDDKLDYLCKILQRLNTAYGEKNDKISNPKPKVSTEDSVIFPTCNNDLGKPIVNQQSAKELGKSNEELCQEDKLSLRKARKEAKKTGKVSDTQKTNLSSDIAQSSSAANGNQTPSINQPTLQAKSKAELKRERREKQEAQRAAKDAAKRTETKQGAARKTETKQQPAKKQTKEEISSSDKDRVTRKTVSRKEQRHLPLLEHLSTQVGHKVLCDTSAIHPAIRSAGFRMQHLIIDGCLSRVLATLSAICQLIDDYVTPPNCDLSRDLCDQLSLNVTFLNSCRPIPEPMNNAIRFVRREINEVSRCLTESEAKREILAAIDVYVDQNIVLASRTIVQNSLEFLEDGDVILTFGSSTLVYETIKSALNSKERLSIIVVDNPGTPCGSGLLSDYSQLGVHVYYRILPDLPHIIHKVTKVLIEAEAVVLNGALVGPMGLAGLILQASTHAVPIVALCHTFKFCNIDLTDSLVVNELGDSSRIVDCPSLVYKNILTGWRESASLNVVNLVYDVTPAYLVNVLVTEQNNLPTSVVPVIIKRNYADILGSD